MIRRNMDGVGAVCKRVGRWSPVVCVLALGCTMEQGTELETDTVLDTTASGVSVWGNRQRGCGQGQGEPSARCEFHADCKSKVCDSYARAGRGECIDQRRVLYVDDDCAGEDLGTGTRTNPFCGISEAVTRAATTGQDVIRVLPGQYMPFGVGANRLRILGPAGEDGVAEVSEEDSGTFSVGEGADVVADGFALGRYSSSALRCDGGSRGARAEVRRSTLRTDVGIPVSAENCEIRLDRTDIRSARGGIRFVNTRYRITNTFISGASERIAVTVSGGEGSFEHVTVVGNYKETSADGPFDCGASRVLIRNSIVFGNRAFGESFSQFQGACELDGVVVGVDDANTSPGAIRLNALLEDGYRLASNPANFACCIDRAPRSRSARWDIVGTRRPQGARNDIGAFELAQ